MKSSKLLLAFCLLVLSVPLFSQEYLIRVDFSERKLFLIGDTEVVITTYSVAIPGFKPNYLPISGFVTEVERNPHWYPTEKTRKHYLEAYEIELPKIVEPNDPLNAMGAAQIIIQFENAGINPLIRIHGTNEEQLIGQKVTSGCIRLHNKDILELVGIIEGKHTKVIFEK